MADRVAALAERADRDPPVSWTPEDPQAGHPAVIGGAIVERGLKVGRGYEGRDVHTVTIETPEGGEWLIWLFHQVLEQEFRPLRVGDVVVVKWEGRKQGRDRSYTSYRVVVDQAGAAAAMIPPESPPDPVTCEQCGFAGTEHAKGCPNETPF